MVLLPAILPLQRTLQVESQFVSLLGKGSFDLGQLPSLFEYFDGDSQVKKDILLYVVNASEELIVDQQADELLDDQVPALEVFSYPDELAALNHRVLLAQG